MVYNSKYNEYFPNHRYPVHYRVNSLLYGVVCVRQFFTVVDNSLNINGIEVRLWAVLTKGECLIA